MTLQSQRFCDFFFIGILYLGMGWPNLAMADAPATRFAGPWDGFYSSCQDLNLPAFRAHAKQFQELLKKGSSWELSVEAEKAQIDKVTYQTCKSWAESPNGDGALREFISQYAEISRNALLLKSLIASEMEPQMNTWWKAEQAEIQQYSFRFEQTPCGKGFIGIKKHIGAQIQSIESRFAVLKDKCPKAADEIIANTKGSSVGVKAVYGKSGGQRAPAGRSSNGSSDVTGLQKAIQQDQRDAPVTNP